MSSRSSVGLCSPKWFDTGSEALTPDVESSWISSTTVSSSFGSASEETRVGSASSESAPSLLNTIPSAVSETEGTSGSMTLSSIAAGITPEPI